MNKEDVKQTKKHVLDCDIAADADAYADDDDDDDADADDADSPPACYYQLDTTVEKRPEHLVTINLF